MIADEGIAELIGLDKEINDLLGGKTISAWDLLADKAGVRFANNATRSAKSARELQILASQATKDSDILPFWRRHGRSSSPPIDWGCDE